MAFKKHPSITTPLDADTLKDLRDSTLQFLKLDLGYFFAAGAVFTALNLDYSTLEKNLPILFFPGSFFVLIAMFDVFTYEATTRAWLLAKTNTAIGFYDKVVLRNTTAQAGLHFSFILLIITFWIGFVGGGESARVRYYAIAQIQQSVDNFIASKGHSPKSMDVLQSFNGQISKHLEALDGEQVTLEPVGDKDYTLRLAGDDGQLFTDDDEIVTAADDYPEIYEKVFPDK